MSVIKMTTANCAYNTCRANMSPIVPRHQLWHYFAKCGRTSTFLSYVTRKTAQKTFGGKMRAMPKLVWGCSDRTYASPLKVVCETLPKAPPSGGAQGRGWYGKPGLETQVGFRSIHAEGAKQCENP